MHIPDRFAEELRLSFGDRFRLRWSDTKHEFHLEQKVRRGLTELPPETDEFGRWDTFSDDYIRAKDGYMLTMVITQGDRRPCPVCGGDIKVPINETREAHCSRCQTQGRDGKYAVAYFDLSDRLLDHIRYIDPETDGPRRVQERVRARQLAHYARMKQEGLDEADYKVMFNKNQVESNPMTGYGPKGRQVEGERLQGAD